MIIRGKHLKEMRVWVLKQYPEYRTFDEVFQAYSSGGKFSQYNAMCSYLWHFHKDEYVWYAHEVSDYSKVMEEGFIAPGSNPKGISIFSPQMLQPKPRIAIHSRYTGFNSDLTHLSGFCNSPPFLKTNKKEVEVCKPLLAEQENKGGYFAEMYKFELLDFFKTGPLKIKETLTERQKRLETCRPNWNHTLLGI